MRKVCISSSCHFRAVDFTRMPENRRRLRRFSSVPAAKRNERSLCFANIFYACFANIYDAQTARFRIEHLSFNPNRPFMTSHTRASVPDYARFSLRFQVWIMRFFIDFSDTQMFTSNNRRSLLNRSHRRSRRLPREELVKDQT